MFLKVPIRAQAAPKVQPPLDNLPLGKSCGAVLTDGPGLAFTMPKPWRDQAVSESSFRKLGGHSRISRIRQSLPG